MPVRRRRQDEAGGREIVELAALADGSIATERRAALEERVAASPELAERLAEQQRALALTRSAAAEVEAPAALRARIESRARTDRLPTFRRPVLVGAAAAAVVAAAIGIGVGVFGSGTSAERFEAALAPTGLAPGARGDATLTRTSSGWRMELNASGLPRLSGGRFYEAWLRGSSGTLVPVGTFNDGSHVTLWAGVSPRQFSTLVITRERADGDQASSGQTVLVGTARYRS
jgi:Anti-sigma-K factor rskA